LKIGGNPKGKDCLPTTILQALVSGRVVGLVIAESHTPSHTYITFPLGSHTGVFNVFLGVHVVFCLSFLMREVEHDMVYIF